jgi:hypothetical protein
MTYQETVGIYLALDDDFVIERLGLLSRLYLTSQNR